VRLTEEMSVEEMYQKLEDVDIVFEAIEDITEEE